MQPQPRVRPIYSRWAFVGIEVTMILLSACVNTHGAKTGFESTGGSGSGSSTTFTATTKSDLTSTITDADTTDNDPPDNPNIPLSCGNGVLDPGEVCDDGNRITELPPFQPHDCIDDCSLILMNCGNGSMDPGESCDDGNRSSLDFCTQSCAINDKGVHAACSRTVDGQSNPESGDITVGLITNCNNIQFTEGLKSGCVLSYSFFGKNAYAAEGDCQSIALACDDSNSNFNCEIAGFPNPI